MKTKIYQVYLSDASYSHLAVGCLVGTGVVIFLLNVGAGLRVTTTWVGAALGLVSHGQGMWF